MTNMDFYELVQKAVNSAEMHVHKNHTEYVPQAEAFELAILRRELDYRINRARLGLPLEECDE